MEAKPGYDDVMAAVEALRANRLATIGEAGRSVQGRPIPVVTLTHPDTPDEAKQLVVVTAGTHGSEEAGRAGGIALMRFLASGQAHVSLHNQKFLIFPCVNPDGSVANSYHNAQDVNVYRSYAPDGPASHEGALVFDIVGTLNPALVIDVHGLAGGAMNEEVYVHPGFRNSPVNVLAPQVAQEARRAAEAAGYPQKDYRWSPDLATSLPGRMAALCNCLAYTVETTENFYPIELMTASALVRLKALIQAGDRRHDYHYYSGYPCEALSGHAMTALFAHGTTAGERAASRREILAVIDRIPDMRRTAADKGSAATVTLHADEAVGPLERFSLQVRLHRPAEIQAVTFAGKELSPGEDHGFVVWEDAASKIVRINVRRPLTPGEHVAQVRYRVSW